MDAEKNQVSALSRLRAARARRQAEANRDSAERRAALLRSGALGAVAGGLAGLGARSLGAPLPLSALGGAALGVGAGALLHRDQRRRQLSDFLSSGGIRSDVPPSTMITGLGRREGQSYIRFNTGNVYRYPDMTDEEHSQLEAAESLGKHFNAVLRARAAERVALPRAGR